MKEIFTSFHVTVKDTIEGTAMDAEGRAKTKIVMFVEARGDTVSFHSLSSIQCSSMQHRNEYNLYRLMTRDVI